MPPHLTSSALDHPALAHGFFGRQGGVSTGIYASLNVGGADEVAALAENRRRVMAALGATHLQTVYQIHSTDVVAITAPLADRPRADGMVTRLPGIALGVLAADCNPILFADAAAGIIGACHAGWRGALGGMALNTVAAMRDMGATDITAVLGPAIQQSAYEVGPEFPAPFITQQEHNQHFFAPQASGKFLFDLPGYLEAQLREVGLKVDRLHEDTYSQSEKYFSYRRTTHQGEPDYGRQIAAIMLRG